ncbi:nucleotide-binding protein [Streptomyces sp. NPDC013178]|uniref:nucleotide-binding protein n=1 Tax=unclassified Streptomyces TaxID=2593676 RepID=UPI0033F30007
MPFHVRVTRKHSIRDEVRLNLTGEELERLFLAPYRQGRPLVIGGTSVAPQDLDKIRINWTEQSAEMLLPGVRSRRARSGDDVTTSDEWLIAASGQDVTDEFITEPPGTSGIPMTDTHPNPGAQADNSRRVFVVHGRNLDARDAMFSFLRSLSLDPIEWNEARSATGKATPYIGDILNAAFREAAAIVVLMTPDDEARLQPKWHEAHDPAHETEFTGQARPNVIFEAGMAMGRDEHRTVLVEMGRLRPFSDIFGRHVLRMNNSSERRQELAHRLLDAGCAVSMRGVDWHKAGDFDACL